MMNQLELFEIWKPVVGYNGIYEVSSYGRVRSLTRKIPCKGNSFQVIQGRVLKQKINTHGRPCFDLWKGNKGKTFIASRLVAKAFLPDFKESLNVDHINGNPRDDRAVNLRMLTNSQNLKAFHKVRKNVSSQYRGVSWCSERKKWIARINSGRKGYFVGRFATEQEAAIAYNEKAIELGYLPEALNKVICPLL